MLCVVIVESKMVISMNLIKSYSELVMLPTFLERFNYLALHGDVGVATFGGHRYLNQTFYRSAEWRNFRHQIIIRDNGCDLAIPGRAIYGPIVIHHINPLTVTDIKDVTNFLMDPDNVISVSPTTHKALHYGNENLLIKDPIERYPNDTCPWKEAPHG